MAEKTTEKVAETEAQETPELPNITAGDLAVMVRVIDAGSQRGAWKGEELGTIGALRDKLATVVKALNPQQEEVAEEAPASDDESAEGTA